MILAIECVVFCLLMWLMCFLGTGSDEKNIKSYNSYPKELRELLRNDEKYKDKIKVSNPIISFIVNTILYLVIVFIFGIFLRKNDFLYNFIALLILGQTVNLFDLLVIDLCWFCNVKRTKFSEYQDKKLYKNPTPHLIAALKALVMFSIIAAIDGALLILF